MTMPKPQVIPSVWTTSLRVGGEVHNMTRTIKETMYIRVNDPFLNRNIGKFQLPHITDELFHNTPALHLK